MQSPFSDRIGTKVEISETNIHKHTSLAVFPDQMASRCCSLNALLILIAVVNKSCQERFMGIKVCLGPGLRGSGADQEGTEQQLGLL